MRPRDTRHRHTHDVSIESCLKKSTTVTNEDRRWIPGTDADDARGATNVALLATETPRRARMMIIISSAPREMSSDRAPSALRGVSSSHPTTPRALEAETQRLIAGGTLSFLVDVSVARIASEESRKSKVSFCFFVAASTPFARVSRDAPNGSVEAASFRRPAAIATGTSIASPVRGRDVAVQARPRGARDLTVLPEWKQIVKTR